MFFNQCVLAVRILTQHLVMILFVMIPFSATSWADMPNWPQISSASATVVQATSTEEKSDASSSTESSDVGSNRRSDVETPSTSQDVGSHNNDPEPANVSWFRNQDYDLSGFLSLEELLTDHQVKTSGIPVF
jgi:hypothetical protein